MTTAAIDDRRRRRDAFLRELAEARALRARVTPWRSRRSRVREHYLRLTYLV